MSGIKFVIPASFSDNALPRIGIDPIMPIQGALMFYEPAHPENPVGAGPVTSGLVIPNLALSQATAMGATGALDASISIAADYLGALGFAERSTKGGVHFSIGTTQNSPSTRYARILGGAGLMTYLNANKTHSYYHSTWARITRAGAAEVSGGIIHSRVGSSFQLPYFYMRPTGNPIGQPVYPADARNIGWFTHGAVGVASVGAGATAKTDTGSVMWAGAVSDFTAVADIFANSILWNLSGSSATAANGASTIFYRAYVEDLTVSGRTYAQVQALDFAEYTKQVLTTGGRYYNDTYTAPLA